ncbi:uncharacterized protein LOC115768082 isoform X2 [Drosophila novamexicana]|uniref:uncharacterized protein LOC115768082 isoform X2 n=1 Tax=Drosophila novamexicana TaxID=47314 RepID=UPI0011E5AB8F|nr:uncharacterized protein LOC115768082 isoform X2 [Drosophila novamexicana]
MLAIKECLIREGVLNLDSPMHGSSGQRHFQLQSSKSSGNMDMPRYRKTFAASSDLSTASATAKTSCQQQVEEQQQQQQPSDESVGSSARVSYRGQHPHFHHHTTPAYYTDLQLRIHTPNASDVGALNENYQSVYSTPSTQLVEQRSFPKTSAAPANQRATFFRLGDSVSTGKNNGSSSSSKERCAKSLPPSVNPTKGEEVSRTESSPQNPIIASNSSCRSPVAPLASPVVVAGVSGRNSRHTHRFQQRSKRAVRVRSESRPISALYDIICKEKGLDVGDSTTTSSSSNSSNEEQQPEEQPKQQQQQKELDKSDKLATFWPLHHQFHRPSMSSVNRSPKSEQSDKRQQLTKQKRVRASADAAGSTDDNDDESPYALHSSQKTTNLGLSKANSLPPSESMSSYLKQHAQPQLQLQLAQPQLQSASAMPAVHLLEDPPLTHERAAKSLEPAARITSSASQLVMSYMDGQPFSTERMFVEPPKLSLPELNRRVSSKKQLDADEQQELNSSPYKEGEVLETLARWQQELSSTNDKSAQFLNGANGHNHHHPYQREHHYHELSASPAPSDHLYPVALEDPQQTQTQSQPQSQSNHHHHQATNARRFITRTPRSGSRQSAGHSSPPPPAGYHSDSSYSSPSPTRRHHPATTATAATEVIATDPQSSANGNSSAYETAATSVMTHAKPAPDQLQAGHIEVPKTTSPASQTNATSVVSTRPASINSDRKKEEDQQQQRPRFSSPSALRTNSTPPARRLSSSELSPKCSGFRSDPSGSAARLQPPARSASQPTEPFERRPLVATANNVIMKQNLCELHFTGGILSPPKMECTLRMRPRSSTLCDEAEPESGSAAASRPRDNLTNSKLSPVQKHKQTPEASPLPRRGGDRDKSAKRKSNLNRSHNEEATKDSDEAASVRRRRRRELGMARPLLPGDDESLRELLQSPQKSSCSESTSKSESLRQARGISQKLNERTKTELAEIKKIAEQAQQPDETCNEQQPQDLKMSPILRRKSTDELAASVATTQNSPPAPNQIVSILKKKEHAFGECNSSASSNASPVTFSATVLDTPLASSRSKRQGILKKRSSLDESRYYSRSHSPDERSILIKSARRNSLEEAGSALSPGQAHGILKQSSYESTKSEGCPSANECQPHSILKKKDSLSTPSDGGAHISKHVSISQAVTLAAAELAAHDSVIMGPEDGEEHEIRPILKQESTSSEEATRPPKPILKKKSFGEADEHEIRPILKSSRKSSREEFDLSEVTQEAYDPTANEAAAMRPILKTDSPSKRRSLCSTQAKEEDSSASLLKRRTRSLERQDAPPHMDLAAALDAITNSQATATPLTPVDLVATPSNISVAERIKHMEMLSTPTSQSAGGAAVGINSSWESPLQHDSSLTPKLLKPSVLRRDLYKDRFKTQPVTSEEKSFFQANSAPFDISATSAFKPTKPLDIRIGAQLQQQQQQQQQQPLISPITGQPLSHVPAPLLLSSSTLSTAGSSYRLARSSTQPLQSPRVVHLAAQGAGTSPSTSSLTNSPQSLLRQHSVSVSDSVSLSEQLTVSVGNDSEHIFEMSGLDNDSALGEDASTATQSSGIGVGVARSSSVRARANMFQQLQEQSRSRREAAGREQLPSQSRSLANSQATSHHSPPPSATVDGVALHTSVLNDESSTPNTTQDATDAEFEPSSLSLAERLAFFSSLCEGAACGSGGNTASTGGARLPSASRSPPYASMMERSPRSSTTGSSVSVTPTPMECSPIIHDLKLPQEQAQLDVEQFHNGFHELSRSATAPTTATITTPLLDAAPTAPRRLRLRTVGKLVLPDTFLTDRNKNNNNNNGHRNSCLGRMQTLEDIHISMGVRTIGKIKSPFIEQQHQQQQHQHQHQSTPTDTSQSKSAKLEHHDSGDDAHGSDSGKENCAANQQKREEEQQASQTTQHIPELRRKLTHLAQITVQQKAPQINRRHTTELGGSPAAGNRSANRSQVDERFAKYFGLDESYNSTTTLLKTRSMPTKMQQPQEALNEHVRLPHLQGAAANFGLGTSIVQRRRELLKRTRAMSFETSACNGCVSPTAMPSPKRAHSPVGGNPSRGGLNIASYEDIVITADELHAAGQEFRRLCGEILGT